MPYDPPEEDEEEEEKKEEEEEDPDKEEPDKPEEWEAVESLETGSFLFTFMVFSLFVLFLCQHTWSGLNVSWKDHANFFRTCRLKCEELG